MKESRYDITDKWNRKYAAQKVPRLPRESLSLALSLTSLLRRRGIHTILDVGCGDGALMRALYVHGFTTFGTEVVGSAPNVFPCPINEMDKTFTDEQFDFVFSIDVLDHVSTRDSVTGAKEMVRVAKYGFAAIVNGDSENQTLLESPDLWLRIFTDIVNGNGQVELKYGRGGVAMVLGWKGE